MIKITSKPSIDPSNAVSALSSGPLIKVRQLPSDTPKHGVYAIYERGRVRHIGESRTMPKLVTRICLGGENFLTWKLARREAHRMRITYNNGPESKTRLRADPKFADVLRQVDARLKEASVRFIEVEDGAERAEICATARRLFGCPYNKE